ncbi:TIGR01440 family protein [Paraliobacillus sediminis]|uniref:TIGR01440 family protein n=1 Tax=Paraliobacillus sediminis TaxID=1885916 RepID=UPI000E3BD72B|nr:TIGR01440 family protein [Paraliobacillus sediminis]
MMQIEKQLQEIIIEWKSSGYIKENQLFVIGCSTSEVIGEHIGTSGSEEVAEQIYQAFQQLQKETGIALAFQCCEHLNRALVIERQTSEKYGYEEVFAVPVRTAGGSMAAFAFKEMKDPVVVEQIKADAGIDIGETMIGMHLKHVAVPLRFKQRTVGSARINAAYTRPKLIGGPRAVYVR